MRLDDKPDGELETTAVRDGRRQLELEREGVSESAIIARVGAAWWQVGGRVVSIRRPVVHRVPDGHLQRTASDGIAQIHGGPKNI